MPSLPSVGVRRTARTSKSIVRSDMTTCQGQGLAFWHFFALFTASICYSIIVSPSSSAPLETTSSSICTPFCNMLELLPSLWSHHDLLNGSRPIKGSCCHWTTLSFLDPRSRIHNGQQNTKSGDVRDAENCNCDLSASPLPHSQDAARCYAAMSQLAPGSPASLRLLLHLGKGLGQLCIFPVGVKAFKGALG